MDEIKRGGEAKLVLDHPLLKEAVDGVRKSLESQRNRASAKDTELHTKLILTEQCLNALEHALRSMITTGEMAQVKLKQSAMERIFQR